jgi:hypothetical protein
VATGLHGKQLGFDAGMRLSGLEPVVPLPRVGDGLLWSLGVVSEVTQAGQDVAAELVVRATVAIPSAR